MTPHKSRKFRAILDFSFGVNMSDSKCIPAVNKSSTKTAHVGAINQLGHSLSRIIHAFAQTDTDANICMSKWDIIDSFWRLDCQEREE